MANWCDNDFVFEVQSKYKEQLENFRKKLEISLANKEGLTDTAKRLGVELSGYTRGALCGVGKLQEMGDVVYFNANVTTAWSPQNELWEKVQEQFGDNVLFYYYVADEPGCQVYVTNDGDGIHFRERWKVDTDDGTETFGNKWEMIDYLNGTYKDQNFTNEMSEDEINSKLNDIDVCGYVQEIEVVDD